MPTTDTLLRRLRDDDRHLRALVHLLTEDALNRPVEELIDPDWLADRLVEGLRASSGDERTRAWVRERVTEARRRLETQQGTLASRIPLERVEPVKELLRRPYTPDPRVVRALLDHRAVRALIRDLLQQALTEYANKVQIPKGAVDVLRQSPLGRGRFAQLAEVAQSAARVVGSEVERQLEFKIREFVDGAITRGIEITVAHFCDPEHAEDIGDWRADSVDVLLALPVQTWRRELDKLDPERLVDDLAALLRAVVASESLRDQARAGLREAVRAGEGMSARAFLDGSGLEEGWRPHIEDLLTTRARAFVHTDAFEEWLQALAADEAVAAG